ncbi:MAG: tetratricopeptide repeat protein [bacterium]|nr:tetratricopeptide repeat protein [bacterium]
MNRRTLLTLAAIFAMALALRLTVLHERSSGPGFLAPIVDAGVYDQTARQLLTEEGAQPRLFWQPLLYPVYLSGAYALTGGSIPAAKVLQALLGAVTCCLTFLLASRLTDRRTALAAAAITCLYGPLILFEGELLAAGWAALWAVALVWLFTLAGDRPSPGWALALGAAGAMAVLTRPTFLPFYGVAWLWLLWRWRGGDRRKAVLALVAGVAAFGAFTLPVAAFSKSVTGHFGFLPGSGGLNSYIGNNPNVCETLSVRPGDEWGELIELPAQAGFTGYAERNRYFYGQVVKYLREDPIGYLTGVGGKALRFASSRELPRNIDVYFSRGESRLLAALSWKLGPFGFPFGLVLPLAILGVARGWRRLGAPLLLFLTLYPLAVVMVFVTARYRVPIVPVLAIPAALGLMELVSALRPVGRHTAVAALIVTAGVLLSVLPGPFCEEALNMEADFYYCLGFAQSERGEVEGAIDSYRRALDSDPGLEQVHYNLGLLHAQRDELEEAEKSYQEAVRILPGHARAHNNLGSVVQRRGDLEGAIEHYTAAADADPEMVIAQRNLAKALLSAGRGPDALARIDTLEGLEPDHAEIPFLRGSALMQTGDVAGATSELRRAVATDPENALAHNDLGTALLGAQDLPAALEQFEKAIALDPEHLQAYNNAGAVLAMTGDLEGARVKFEEVVRRSPEYADARYNLATILLRLGDVGRGVEELQQVLRLQPNHPRATKRLQQLMAQMQAVQGGVGPG